jgi:hypothetical protein
MKKILLTESEKKAIISAKEKAIMESFAKTFNSIKRIDENEINEGPNVLFPDWLITKLNDVHTKVGQGSIFAMDINKVVEIAKQVVGKEQNIEQIANSTGTISTQVNGAGYDLVLPMEKAKTLPNAQTTTTNKVEGPTTLEVPAVKTSAPLQSFKTNQLTIIVRPMKNEAGEVIPNGYIILSVFPGNPNIPRISEWDGQYAVIIPDQQGQPQQPQQVSEVIDDATDVNSLVNWASTYLDNYIETKSDYGAAYMIEEKISKLFYTLGLKLGAANKESLENYTDNIATHQENYNDDGYGEGSLEGTIYIYEYAVISYSSHNDGYGFTASIDDNKFSLAVKDFINIVQDNM